jgi:mRNA interferase MazF
MEYTPTIYRTESICTERIIRMGDVYRIAFPESGVGNSVQSGIRPAIVVSNNQNNKYSPTIQVIPLTTSRTKKARNYPMHVLIPGDGILLESVAMVEQLTPVSKSWIVSDCLTTIPPEIMVKLGAAFRVQFPISQFA